MKLEGIKVLDLSLFLPGPHLSMMMADHGAEVISLEPPGGEPIRNIGLKANSESVWFRNLYRGKKSINLNLKSEEGKEAFLRLCEQVDVVIEAFRPGVVNRLGIDYGVLSQRNPKLVMCSISAFGQTGPKRLKPAHDLSIEADSGAVFINQGQDGKPAMPGMPVADMAASLMALNGILMALLRRETTGQGDYLDISMQDALVSWYANVMGPCFAEQRSPEPKLERSWGGNAMYQLYQCADGQYLSLGGSELHFAKNLFTKLGREDLYALCKLPPGQQQTAIAFLRDTFIQQPLAYWQEWFADIDVCWSPVQDLNSAIRDPHLAEREMLVKDADGNEHLGVPIKFLHEPAQPEYRLPAFSQDTRSVLLSLGYSQTQIDAMEAAQAFIPSTREEVQS